jgi:eukaryotic-like serine/threonine-protein kinase
MSDCPSCGAELPEASPQGPCPVCLLKLGLSDPSLPSSTAEGDEPSAGVQQLPPAEPAGRRLRPSWPILAAAGAILLAGIAVLLSSHRSVPPLAPVLRFALYPPKDAMDFAVSPDGLRLVYTAKDDQGITLLWIHSFDAFAERQLPGTDGAASPFWRPDSRSVGFFAGRKLKTIDISGVAPQVLCDAPSGKTGTWNVAGTIVFAPNVPGPMFRVSSAGGVPQPVAPVDGSNSQIFHRSPQFLPDGRHFIYAAETANPQNGGVFVGSLDSRETRRLAAGSAPAYTQSSMLFVENGVLMAQPFDPSRLELAGEARRIPFADQIQSFSVSENGILAYQTGEHQEPPLVFIDRSGKQVQAFDEARGARQFRISPDGKVLALSRFGDIWLSDLSRGVTSRFTFDPASETFPVWAPDAKRIVFLSNRNGANGIYEKKLSGEMEELLFNAREAHVESIDDWSSDGRFIIYTGRDPRGKTSLWALSLSNERKPFSIESGFNTRQGRLSPDGRWLAYVSDESGRDEIHLEAFPGRENKAQVSTAGGTNPRWRRDGRELFYVAPGGQLMSVTVSANPSPQLGIPNVLFGGVSRDAYEVMPDGFFVTLSNLERSPSQPINIVVNWANDQKQE